MIGTLMACCRGYGHWCWHRDPGVGYVDAPPTYGGPRHHRRSDEEALSAHLEELEDEVREVRRRLGDLRASRQDARL